MSVPAMIPCAGKKENEMPGYKHPCRYCGSLVEADARFCPLCGKVNPAGSLRCPACGSAVETGFKACSHCGLMLEGACPKCGKTGCLIDYCQHCGERLVMTCPNRKCGSEQSVLLKICSKCGKPLTSK
jgi:RNA polymerase subunit RPABC4/transcription elongation factor Spt4